MALHESITNQTNVSLRIAKHLFLKELDKNIVFSPLSLQVVLSIIAAGSEGPTQQQLLDFLLSKSTDHLNDLASQLVSVVLFDAAPTGGPRFSFVNGVWVEQTLSLQPSFKEIVSSDYKATLLSVDFKTKAVEVTKEGNLWAEKETNGLIKELLPPRSVDSLTRLIFANALYFKGAWSEKFDVLKTKDYDFHLLNGSSVKVPFMTSEENQFIEAYGGFKVLRLPYKKGKDKRRFSMYIFLPNAKDGLPALVEKLAAKPHLLHYSLHPAEAEVVEFRIPRFKISFELETSDMFKELGVILPFTRGGLTKMVDSPLVGNSLSVSKIFHKSFIEVNEEGTEAAAASAGCYEEELDSKERIDFVADHPFLFLIRENSTGTILFVGQVLNPLDE
ncbi:serpin-ZX [Medicago truncatula]|uniref:Serpin-like protein n=2 Tax=Medicago truncatula TaxID=3880 RepID=G7IW05_MEDTR|nr:serpin-ZX [Medicago truncatula]AES68894.2 serpin-like protein [Medicago truncatula]